MWWTIFQNPNKIDLRYFRTIQQSDSWDGRTTCHNGWTSTILLYDGNEVARTEKLRMDGSRELTSRHGSDFHRKMNRVAESYFAIVRRWRHVTGIETDETTANCINIDTECLKILKGHPQFLDFLKDATERGHSVQLIDDAGPSHTHVLEFTKINS